MKHTEPHRKRDCKNYNNICTPKTKIVRTLLTRLRCSCAETLYVFSTDLLIAIPIAKAMKLVNVSFLRYTLDDWTAKKNGRSENLQYLKQYLI